MHTKKGITAHDKQQRHINWLCNANYLIMRILIGGG